MFIIDKNIINKEFINNIFFLFNIIFIFSSEIFFYFFYYFYYFLYSYFISRENTFFYKSNIYENMIDNITYKLASINILYVKIFQAIALNNNLIDEYINKKLLQFTDNVIYNNNDIDINTLINICNNYNLLIDDYYKPINSGMISLVYKATDLNITNETSYKIIKIKRLNIEKKLNKAINNLIFITNIISLIPFINRLKLNNIIYKNIDLIQQQTNFINEISNMKIIKNNCKKLKYILIPNAIEDITYNYNNVIVMDFIDGKNITLLEHNDINHFGKLIIKFGFITAFLHGVTHGDLHPGNILFIKDYNENNTKYIHKLGIIDFGIIYNFDLELRENILNIFIDFNNKEIHSREIVINFLNTIILPKNILNEINKNDYNEIIHYGINIIDEIRNLHEKVNQIYFYKFFDIFSKYLNKPEFINKGIYINENFTKLQLVIAMSQGLTLALCREKFINIINDTLNELFFI